MQISDRTVLTYYTSLLMSMGNKKISEFQQRIISGYTYIGLLTYQVFVATFAGMPIRVEKDFPGLRQERIIWRMVKAT